MGKFGKFNLPEFVLKKFGPNVATDENATLEEERIPGEGSADDTQKNDQEMNTDLEKHKVFESFQDFQSHVAETPIGEDEDQNDETEEVNEEDMLLKEPEKMAQPCEGCSDHPDTLSENAKNAIKQICNEVLIKEAHIYETSEDPNQTYETFLRECTHYMAECLIRASQNLKV